MNILRTWTLAAACLTSSFASAQDMIVTNDGKSIKAYNLEISSNSVFYQLENKSDAPLQKMLKSEILIIKKADGTKLDFDATTQPATTTSTSPSQSATTQITVESLSPAEKAANEALIAKYNQEYDTNVGDIGKNSNAQYAYMRFGVTSNSVLENEDIAINVVRNDDVDHTLCYAIYNADILFTISNKTDNTLYIDLGHTFYVSMGQPYAYYIPSSTTDTKGSSAGVGVNVGAITSALGVGGALGTLASGINIGGGKSGGTSTTTYSQRVIAIPPHATYTLDPRLIFDKGNKIIRPGFSLRSLNSAHKYCSVNFSEENGGRIKDYDHYTYSELSSPLKMSFFTVYSKAEDFATSSAVHAELYLKELYGYDLFITMLKEGKLPTHAKRREKYLLDNPVLILCIKATNDKNQPSFPKQ